MQRKPFLEGMGSAAPQRKRPSMNGARGPGLRIHLRAQIRDHFYGLPFPTVSHASMVSGLMPESEAIGARVAGRGFLELPLFVTAPQSFFKSEIPYHHVL